MGDVPSVPAVPTDDQDNEEVIAAGSDLAPDGIPFLDEGDETWLSSLERMGIDNSHGDPGLRSAIACLCGRRTNALLSLWAGRAGASMMYISSRVGRSHDDVRRVCVCVC
jgi:hypothetical protein